MLLRNRILEGSLNLTLAITAPRLHDLCHDGSFPACGLESRFFSIAFFLYFFYVKVGRSGPPAAKMRKIEKFEKCAQDLHAAGLFQFSRFFPFWAPEPPKCSVYERKIIGN